MRVLITGGAGFIGSHLVDRMIRDGHSVTILDDLSTGTRDNVEIHETNPEFRAVYDTILAVDAVDELVREADVVFHLAAAVGVKYIIENPLHSMRVNVRGTENVLEAADRHRTKVVLFSTSEIYGKSPTLPFREDADRLLGPTTIHRWAYSTAKAVDEILGLAYHEERDLPVVIVRCFNTCGPRQRGRYGMVIPRFVDQAIRNEPLTVYGDGTQTRCFGSVFDVVEGVTALLDCHEAEGEIFNVGSNEEVSILQLARRIRELTGSRSEIELVPYAEAYEPGFEDMMRRVPDLRKIHEFVRYEPSRKLDDILFSVIEHRRASA
ncbi:MAG: UDP-glucose 4-epimerase [Gemmatimonadota bacterium]|nr:MAG: UDP-glucose 4-epimerase [Gemmatimonadota bacterium]